MDIEFFKELIRYEYEKEWIEFKENWYNREEIGEYISALSNVATICGVPYSYMIWGIKDKTHEVTGTSFNFDKEEKCESLKHYLSRNLTPSILYTFEELEYLEKRVVILTISAAKLVPTEFNKERFIRIGSSKEQLRKFPIIEASLWEKLRKVKSCLGAS